MQKYVIGITGASGSIYGSKLLKGLLEMKHEVHLVITDYGRKVLEYELDLPLEKFLSQFKNLKGNLILYDINDLFAPIASGSFQVDGMIIIPCSMSTLAKISNGISDNLLIRAADVCIKEKRKLILVPRETPLSSIHLENMLNLSQMGVTVLPAMPCFYSRPETVEDMVDSIVGRVLLSLGIKNSLYYEWDGGL